jgi:hypothetical protein
VEKQRREWNNGVSAANLNAELQNLMGLRQSFN